MQEVYEGGEMRDPHNRVQRSLTRNYSDFERFVSQIKIKDDCWVWTGNTLSYGYGQMNFNGKPEKTHRVSYTLAYGPIPKGLFVCHKCDVRNCVKPSHLFIGTHQENMRDMVKKGRTRVGIKHTRSKLKPDQVVEIRKLHQMGVGIALLSKQFKISYAGIKAIVLGQVWRHIRSV